MRAENTRLRGLLRRAGVDAARIEVEHARELGRSRDDLRQATDEAEVAGRETERALAASRAEIDELEAANAALARSERRQAALVELSDRFRDVEDVAEMAFLAAEVMGRSTEVSRAGYGSIDPALATVQIVRDWTIPGETTIAGTYRFGDFGSFFEDLAAGSSVAISDVALDPRTAPRIEAWRAMNIRAFLNVPVIERGRLVALFFLHSAAPRDWTPRLLAFARDVAQRTRDAVERRRSEDHQRMLQGELQHRVKNTLAMVQAIANQSFRETESLAARDAFASRVIALSRANDVLTRAGWVAAPIVEVVSGATVPHCASAERFRISGPAIEIAARAALALTLALHELCTNAAKYGALSNDGGHVDIAWEVGADAVFRLRWLERGGPRVSPPTRTGFGSRLIQRSLGPQLNGQVSTAYEPDGVVFTLVAPLASVQEAAIA